MSPRVLITRTWLAEEFARLSRELDPAEVAKVMEASLATKYLLVQLVNELGASVKARKGASHG